MVEIRLSETTVRQLRRAKIAISGGDPWAEDARVFRTLASAAFVLLTNPDYPTNPKLGPVVDDFNELTAERMREALRDLRFHLI